jgi:hypothetical protein
MRGMALVLLTAFCAAAPAFAEDMPVFKVELKDGTISPSRLTVPANTAFKIEVSNTGASPAEFESLSLHKEKVVAAGITSSLVFRRLEAGDYDFFDDFHPEAKATLIAK